MKKSDLVGLSIDLALDKIRSIKRVEVEIRDNRCIVVRINGSTESRSHVLRLKDGQSVIMSKQADKLLIDLAILYEP